ncbi:MAG: FGGY family carbohydrate kinase, partial [Actinomycetota bacterium]
MRALVIDIGTSGLRAAVVNDDASVTDLHHEEFAPQSPAGGLVEFDAAAMYDAVLRVSSAAMNGRPVDCVGITNQRASAIGWRRSTGMPIGPAIGWQDLRTVGECMMARAEHGLALAPNQTATKIAWLLTNHVADPVARADDDILFGTVETRITPAAAAAPPFRRSERRLTEFIVVSCFLSLPGLTAPPPRRGTA